MYVMTARVRCSVWVPTCYGKDTASAALRYIDGACQPLLRLSLLERSRKASLMACRQPQLHVVLNCVLFCWFLWVSSGFPWFSQVFPGFLMFFVWSCLACHQCSMCISKSPLHAAFISASAFHDA